MVNRNFYTPDYCQTRCTSLRNQYNREKRILESQYKSGSGPSSHKLFPFYNQLTFLDTYVRRRRTHNNIEVNKSLISSTLSAKVLSEISKSDPNEVLDNEKSNDSIYKEDNGEKNKENMLENTSRNVTHKRTITEKESYVLHTKPVKYKKSKVDETKECNDIFTSVSQKIISALDNKNKSNENEAFAEFIIAHLASLPQSQQNIRKRMITDALFSPLQEM
ncbi:uncharacterized protein LOC118647321 isoform X2 [Monomorium pharaonis]|uniref:uncharacterized protein LOC118647321 isoform X2 n=1 Tax=Monomorium pharaonis TaxID=307658 RepID=UPI001746A336|nr:uncharacterized protein LOC118647321 isoform X2 [Monomorium pharaonis]